MTWMKNGLAVAMSSRWRSSAGLRPPKKAAIFCRAARACAESSSPGNRDPESPNAFAFGPHSFRVHGEPDGRLVGVGPLDAMADVGRDLEVAAGRQDSRLLPALDPHARRAAQHDHPFRPVLVVPKAGRARLPGRDDPLDARARKLGEDRGLL